LRRGVLALLCLGLPIAALFVGWEALTAPSVERLEPLPKWEVSFTGPAFAPDATAQQLNAEAEREVSELIEAFPNSAAALNVFARWNYASGNADKAIEAWQRCLTLNPDFREPLYALGTIALDADEHKKAVRLLGRLRRLDQTDVRVPALLAEALLESGKVMKARALLEKHVGEQQTTAESMSMLGQVYLRLREYERAIRCFETAAEAAPEMKSAHYGLGQAYARSGQSEKAQEALQAFRRCSQRDLREESEKAKRFRDTETSRLAVAQALGNAGRVYRNHGETGKAEELFRKAITLDPRGRDVWDQLLTLLEETGRYREALQVAERLVEMNPRDVDCWLNAAVLNAHLQRGERALAALEKATELDPNNPRCRKARQLIAQGQ
jgi:tetratricopeptide (TPR) repeat protein